jgi:hypothetical protein
MKAVFFTNTQQTNQWMNLWQFFSPRRVRSGFYKVWKVLGTGAFGNPGEGAMAIFVDKESAEAFVNGDPFVQEGLIAKVTIREWNDELA